MVNCKRKSLESSYTKAALLFLTPSLAFFAVFFVFPLFFTLYLSFHEWDMLSPLGEAKGIGLSNFAGLFSDSRFVKTLLNTFIYVGSNLVLMPVIALVIALLLKSTKFLPRLWRLIFFLPVVTSVVAMSLVWQYIFDPTFGPLNEFLKALGLPPQGWTMAPSQSLPSILIVLLWQGAGYYAIIYLAGLMGISRDYYEAAELDGANGWQSFRSITLPFLRPTTEFVLVMIAVNTFQVFTPIFVITNGGPVDSSNVLGLYIYQTAFEFLKMGKASSMAVVLFVLVMSFSVIQIKIMRRNANGQDE
jgi:ABC-type sugar transport system permease subunit